MTDKGRASQPDEKSYQRGRKTDLQRLLKQLKLLEETTRPQDGSASAPGKDEKAQRALELCAQLVQELAGWAIHHQIGLAAEGLSPISIVTEPLQSRSLLGQALKKVDRHHHEIVGADISKKPIPDEVARRSLLNLLETNPGGFPSSVAKKAVKALLALEYNEVLPIFRPRKSRRKVSHSELELQLWAVACVEHRVALREVKRHEATKGVAGAFHVSPNTLRSWKQRLQRELGALFVESRLAHARDSDFQYFYDDKALRYYAESYRKVIRLR